MQRSEPAIEHVLAADEWSRMQADIPSEEQLLWLDQERRAQEQDAKERRARMAEFESRSTAMRFVPFGGTG